MRPGPGLVVMVLAFFTGARPTNTFSSRDYDRRLLRLSTLSQPSLPQPPPPPSPPSLSPSSSAPPPPDSVVSPLAPSRTPYDDHFYYHSAPHTSFFFFRPPPDYYGDYTTTTTTKGGGAATVNRHNKYRSRRSAEAAGDETASVADSDIGGQIVLTGKNSASYHRPRSSSESHVFSDYFHYQPEEQQERPPAQQHKEAESPRGEEEEGEGEGVVEEEEGSERQSLVVNQQQQQQYQLHKRTEEYPASSSSEGGPLVAESQVRDDDQSFVGGALARINPWLSACDLAQPSTAPDLQGQCTAGKLPVAWVDEGPGPPACPENCGTLKEQSNYEKRFNLNVVNRPSMDNNSTISGDSHIITRDSRKTNKRGRGDMCHDVRNRPSASQPGSGRTESGEVPSTQLVTTTEKSAARSESDQKTNPCLDSLGDAASTQPEYICRRGGEIARELQRLRLRHCCERNLFTALHGRALEEVLRGGKLCVQHLKDLMQTDALATRITCEFTEILVRYDCRQMYSIIHHCEDCKEAYRRWVCSTLIPYFDYVDRERPPNNKETAEHNSGSGSKNVNKRNVPATEATTLENNKMTIVDSSSDPTKKRSRRKSNPEKIRTRIRPCLSVCQTVEQKCPYLLPGDRAPAHPTQYAGEPTFLCLDPNIPETGEQKIKSNHGPDNCCYEYCDNGAANRQICSRCVWNETVLQLDSENMEVDEDHASPEISAEIEVEATLDYYRDNSYPSEVMHCVAIPVPINHGISTVRTSVLPNTRCPIPYYIGPELHRTKEEQEAESASSSGVRRHQSLFQSLNVILVLSVVLVLLSLATGSGSHFITTSQPLQICCWSLLLLLDTSLGRICRECLLLMNNSLGSCKKWGKRKSRSNMGKFMTWTVDLLFHCRQWWRRQRQRETSSSILDLLLFSSITRYPRCCCCCRGGGRRGGCCGGCWRTGLYFRKVTPHLRTLKCQLLLSWDLGPHFTTIRDYNPSHHISRCRYYWNNCCQTRHEQRASTPPSPSGGGVLVLPANIHHLNNKNSTTTEATESPSVRLLLIIVFITISSRFSQVTESRERCGSARRENNNAKTVVRWVVSIGGTIGGRGGGDKEGEAEREKMEKIGVEKQRDRGKVTEGRNTEQEKRSGEEKGTQLLKEPERRRRRTKTRETGREREGATKKERTGQMIGGIVSRIINCCRWATSFLGLLVVVAAETKCNVKHNLILLTTIININTIIDTIWASAMRFGFAMARIAAALRGVHRWDRDYLRQERVLDTVIVHWVGGGVDVEGYVEEECCGESLRRRRRSWSWWSSRNSRSSGRQLLMKSEWPRREGYLNWELGLSDRMRRRRRGTVVET